VALGTDHARREGLRARLKAGRLSSPLFDTDTWVRPLSRPHMAQAGLLQPAGPALCTMLCAWHSALRACFRLAPVMLVSIPSRQRAEALV
jgi:hypothetical protein